LSTLIELQPAYLLHSRPFRDNSLILDFLTPDFGRLSAISRGGRSARSKSKSLLQPFTPVTISLSGKSELKTLRSIELRRGLVSLKGERLFSAMYMNEIIVRLFQTHEADHGFFQDYETALLQLGGGEPAEPVLRNFELTLLDALGYGVDFNAEAQTHQPLSAEHWYYFQEESGFVKVQDAAGLVSADKPAANIFSGRDLLQIHERNFSEESTRRTAKLVIRGILGSHLGTAPLRSRSLFGMRQAPGVGNAGPTG